MMFDKNGKEIKTGCIVKITNAYFKSDNGIYFVTRAPGDASWSGEDYSLTKISKTGRISKAKYKLGSWPIHSYTNSLVKRAEASQWNKEHAEIEVVSVTDMSEVKSYFQQKAEETARSIDRCIFDYGEDSPVVKKEKEIKEHWDAVVSSIC